MIRDFIDFYRTEWREAHPVDFWVRSAVFALLVVAGFYLAVPMFIRTFL